METHGCFTVRDANGQALAYVYFEDRHDHAETFVSERRDIAHASGVMLSAIAARLRTFTQATIDKPRHASRGHRVGFGGLKFRLKVLVKDGVQLPL